MPHYRRLSPSEFEALTGETAYEKGTSIQSVVVGRPSGDYVLHVHGPSRPDLPGSYLADTLAELHHATRAHVAEARWTVEQPEDPEDPESPTVTVEGFSKVAHIPAGATVLATDLNPHSWS